MSVEPSAQLRAGHIPADLYAQTGGRPVVIVQRAPARSVTSYLGPVAVILAVTGGVIGTAFALMALAQFAAQTAAAIGASIPAALGGVSVAVRLRKGATK